MIQYKEQDDFIDFIERSDLADVLKRRISEGVILLQTSHKDIISNWLSGGNIFPRAHGDNSLQAIKTALVDRIDSLKLRLEKLER